MKQAKVVLVTGAGTGIGRDVTERLSAAGHFVYAGVRRESDLGALKELRGVTALRFDVTRSDDIAAAFHAIERGGLGLYGLVNNAGVATYGTVADCNDDEFDLVMNVNVRGVYRVTRTFLPLIAACRGRVVMIGSISGILSEGSLSAYSMSKHAVEAFSDALSSEMEESGIGVSTIEPGTCNTQLSLNIASRIGADSRLPDLSACTGTSTVADAILSALFDATPRRRYLVANAAEVKQTIRKQIQQLVELNQDHVHTYSRHELIQMLDEGLAMAGRSAGQ